MPLTSLPLPDADVRLDPHWLPQAEALFDALLASAQWEVHRIRLFGREVDSPRLSSWIGDPGGLHLLRHALHAPPMAGGVAARARALAR
jgi:alkylated DNA repair dioxygenase AlkB